MDSNDPLLAPIAGCECREIGGAQIELFEPAPVA